MQKDDKQTKGRSGNERSDLTTSDLRSETEEDGSAQTHCENEQTESREKLQSLSLLCMNPSRVSTQRDVYTS